MRRYFQLAGVALAVAVTLLTVAEAQRNSGGSKASAPSLGTTGRTNPTTNAPQQNIYYVGKVLLDTGTAPPSSVAVMRICNGFRHRETFTSSDGSFSFLVGDRSNDMLPDASEDTREFGLNNPQRANANPMTMGQSNFQSPVADCELRADLAGYTSSSIRLDQTMANSDVGVIVLHSRGKQADGMISVASLKVPPKARKEFEKGSELLEKGNFADAEKSLRKAIDLYPKFAEAWLRLGDLEQRRKNGDGAMKDYQEAINADPNFALPYLRMAYISAVAGNWEQTRNLTERMLGLDPVNFPLGYYYNAVAEFNLKHIDKAENSALRAENLDKQHLEPRVEVLLATIYSQKGNYSSAADHYRAYLKLVPNGPLTEQVKSDLAKIEEMAKAQSPPSGPASNK
jgi:tetratricopeptide (TPR) repeat protein